MYIKFLTINKTYNIVGFIHNKIKSKYKGNWNTEYKDRFPEQMYILCTHVPI